MSSVTHNCGWAQQTLVGLYKDSNYDSASASFSAYFFKPLFSGDGMLDATSIPLKFKPHADGSRILNNFVEIPVHDDAIRCKECARTIAEHSASDIAMRTGAHVSGDRIQGVLLALKVQQLNPNDAVLSTVNVIFDTGCAVSLLLSEEEFGRVVGGAALEVLACSEAIGGRVVKRKAFAHVSLPEIDASADCVIHCGPRGAVCLFGLPLMHIRCNPDKSVSKCKEIFMGYRCHLESTASVLLRTTSPITGETAPKWGSSQ